MSAADADGEALRRTLGSIANGVFVLAARDGAQTGAATVAWVTQVSFKPPLIAVALGRNSNVFRCLAGSGAATLHLAGRRQLALARAFACPTEAGGGRINGEPWSAGATSAPVLAAFPAHVECRLEQIFDTTGDHALVILRALNARCRDRFQPMSLAQLREYLKTRPLPPRAPVPADAARPAAAGP